MLTSRKDKQYNKHNMMLCEEIIRVAKAVHEANGGKTIRFSVRAEDRDKVKGGDR